MAIQGTSVDDILTFNLGNRGEFISIRPGGGNDDITGGDGFNRLDYINAAGGVTVNVGTGLTTDDGDGGQDTFSNIFEFRGTDFQDIFTGSAGDDRFITRAGNDVVDGAGGIDLVRYDRDQAGAVNVDLQAETATGIFNGLAFS
ncbi:MAG: hypothetical protein ACKVH0_00910 [Alphaproteobacteria bacterium]